MPAFACIMMESHFEFFQTFSMGKYSLSTSIMCEFTTTSLGVISSSDFEDMFFKSFR